MIRIIVNGARGHMGLAVASKVRAGYLDSSLVGEADAEGVVLADITAEADAIIDFSHHAATDALLSYAISRAMPVVIATTGQTDAELDAIRKASGEIPIFLSANMSLGIAVLLDIAKRTAAAYPSADIEIVEAHHNRKLDAPSGTALMLADGLRAYRAVAADIPIHSLRMGDVIGVHKIYIDNGSERIELTHTANSRSLFAEGSIAAAAFLADRKPGLYNMGDMINA
jgi:4-hydroxy-tetrahydrodipicolinate reductase